MMTLPVLFANDNFCSFFKIVFIHFFFCLHLQVQSFSQTDSTYEQAPDDMYEQVPDDNMYEQVPDDNMYEQVLDDSTCTCKLYSYYKKHILSHTHKRLLT